MPLKSNAVPPAGRGCTTANLFCLQEPEYARWKQRYKSSGSTFCDETTDDDGATLLHQGDHDLDPDTPLRCAGQDFAEDDSMGKFVPFAYDAAIALFKAIHAAQSQRLDVADGEADPKVRAQLLGCSPVRERGRCCMWPWSAK